MHHHATTTARQAASRSLFAAARLPARAGQPGQESDRAFIGMLESYRGSGGLARAQEVFTLFKSRNALDVETLAHWMAQRTVISLEWHADVWLPLFQFERQHMTVKPALEPVLAALNPVFTPWELAHWCAQPHRWLDQQSPADALDSDAAGVLRAACADRFALL
jgi:hypothetical protein